MIPQLQMLEQQQQHQAEMYQKSKSLGPAQIFMRDTKGKPQKPVFMPFLIYTEMTEPPRVGFEIGPNKDKRVLRNSTRKGGLQVCQRIRTT